MFATLIGVATAGALAKISDDYSDKNLQISPSLAILLSIIYGLILGYLTSTTILSSLFIALAMANVLAQKIDKVHLFGFISFSAMIIYSGIAYFDPYIFCLFLISGLFDELELKRPKFLTSFFENRLATPLAALLVFLHYSQPLFLLAIVAFDIPYKIADYFIAKRLSK